jgi:hypothetical protein
MPRSVHARFAHEREKVLILQRDMIIKAQRIIEKQRIEIARLKSEIARLERKTNASHDQRKSGRTA